MPTPNKTNLRKWVKELREGAYEQTTGHLRDGDGYCCLGVACEAAIKDGVPLEVLETTSGDAMYGDESNYLPVVVREWLGVEFDPQLEHGQTGAERATMLNDSLDYDFHQIADAIERTFNI